MAYILLHTSSKDTRLQEQALSLQSELQSLGHDIDFSTTSHPARLIKNRYDVLHILSETDALNLKDLTLLLAAKVNQTATLVSTFNLPQALDFSAYHKLQSLSIDAFSSSNIESLRRSKMRTQKIQLKPSFILPLLPKHPIIPRSSSSLEKFFSIKVIDRNFNQLKQNRSHQDNLMTKNFIVDASALLKKMTMPAARKAWTQFQKKNPSYQDCILVLKSENTFDLLAQYPALVDLSQITDGLQFHTYFEQIYKYQQFTVLNANQASGFADYWKHQQNCWITDLKKNKKWSSLVEETQITLAKSYFQTASTEVLETSLEKKINELSRLYSKMIIRANLSYTNTKAHS